MSDIVQRLRADKCMVPMHGNPGISEYRTRPLSDEAADEIEHLRLERDAAKSDLACAHDRLRMERAE